MKVNLRMWENPNWWIEPRCEKTEFLIWYLSQPYGSTP